MDVPFAAPSPSCARLALAAVMSLTVACGGSGSAAPPRALSSATRDGAAHAHAVPLCEPIHDVLLPRGFATGLSLTDVGGKLAIDGTVTAVTSPPRAPLAYALADGRVLLDVADSTNELLLWDPAARTLTSLGTGGLTPASTLGFLVHTLPAPGTVVFSGIDPHAPRLRELYQTTGSLTVAGTLDGALAILEHQSGVTMNAALVCLSAPGEITRIPIDLPASMQIAGDDAIRDHRLLLVGHVTDGPHDGWAREPFEVPVELLDLDTRAHRRLGNARGSYTAYTDMPHRYARVLWSDIVLSVSDENPPRVDVATEMLR